MSVELRARQAASAMHRAVAEVRPVELPSTRQLFVRRAVVAVVVAAVAVLAAIAIARNPAGDDTSIEDKIADRPQRTAEVGVRPSRKGGTDPGSGVSPQGSRQIVAPGENRTESVAPAGPSEGRVVFVSAEPEAEIYVMNLDGSGRTQLGTGIEPDWSPDGESIAYARGRKTGNCEYAPAGVENPDPCDVWVMDADGSNQRRLAAGFSPDWSPDGRRIAYAGGDDNDPEIRVMNADGSGNVQLTDGDDAIAGRPDWSPDGTRIAFGRNWRCDSSDLPGWCSHTEVMDATGGDQHFVINGIAPSWSPDGNRIAYMAGGDGNIEIYTARSDGSDVRRLTNDAKTASTMDNFDAWPAWSPDGRIIFTRDPDGPPTKFPPCWAGWSGSPTDAGAGCGAGGPGRPEIFLMNADGSGRVRLGEGRMADVIGGRT